MDTENATSFELDLSRQSKLVPGELINQYFFKVFGVGSIGSHFVKTLAKTGFKNIEVYDMDIVEQENIAAQAYDFKHIGMRKVDAIKEIVKDSSGIDIKTQHGMVDENTIITPEPNTFYCCFFDSFEARKLVFDKVKDYPVLFIDGRIGKYDMRHYLVDCSNDIDRNEYSDSLGVKAVSELVCGEKACAPINTQISGMIIMNIINYIYGRDYIKVFIGNASAPKNNIIVIKPLSNTLINNEN